MPPMGSPPLESKTTPPPPLKNEAPFQEMILRKKSGKSETVINTCVSLKNNTGKNGGHSTECLVLLRNYVNKTADQFNSLYINMWLSSLNIFEKN